MTKRSPERLRLDGFLLTDESSLKQDWKIKMNKITLENSKSYASEARLDSALCRLGLDRIEGLRFINCRTAEGKWTAVFLITEYLQKNGGYVGLASQHGFVSV